MSHNILLKENNIASRMGIRISERTVGSFPLHTHDYFELEVVLAGRGTHFLNSAEYPLERGSAALLTPADCHAVRAEDGDELVIYNVSFEERLLTPAERSCFSQKGRGSLSADVLERFVMAVKLLSLEVDAGGSVEPLLEYVLELTLGKVHIEDVDAIERATLYADTHFRDDPSTADGARVACLSTVYFGALFKKIHGVCFRTYVNSKKLDLAKNLLKNGMSVSGACYESGFGSISNFSKLFYESFGVSPGRFRRESKEN